MAKTDTVERLIRQGQDKMTDEVQDALLYQINGKIFKHSRIEIYSKFFKF